MRFTPTSAIIRDMLGALLGLASAAIFAISNTLTRRGVLRATSGYVANISIFAGCAFFLLVNAVTGDLFKLGRYSWLVFVLFAIQGIIHFAFGRTWAYRCFQLIGAVRAQVVTSLNVVVSIVLALIIFREKVTPLVILGIALCMCGVFLLSAKESVRKAGPGAVPDYKKVDRRTLTKGIFFGLGTALFWGASTILVKLALNHGGIPLVGNFIAYTAATLAISPAVFSNAPARKELLSTRGRLFLLALFSGLTTGIAHTFRYFALDYGSVIVVSLMFQTSPLWTMLLAFTFNRKFESFSRWALLGNGTVLAGVLLVLFA